MQTTNQIESFRAIAGCPAWSSRRQVTVCQPVWHLSCSTIWTRAIPGYATVPYRQKQSRCSKFVPTSVVSIAKNWKGGRYAHLYMYIIFGNRCIFSTRSYGIRMDRSQWHIMDHQRFKMKYAPQAHRSPLVLISIPKFWLHSRVSVLTSSLLVCGFRTDAEDGSEKRARVYVKSRYEELNKNVHCGSWKIRKLLEASHRVGEIASKIQNCVKRIHIHADSENQNWLITGGPFLIVHEPDENGECFMNLMRTGNISWIRLKQGTRN